MMRLCGQNHSKKEWLFFSKAGRCVVVKAGIAYREGLKFFPTCCDKDDIQVMGFDIGMPLSNNNYMVLMTWTELILIPRKCETMHSCTHICYVFLRNKTCHLW